MRTFLFPDVIIISVILIENSVPMFVLQLFTMSGGVQIREAFAYLHIKESVVGIGRLFYFCGEKKAIRALCGFRNKIELWL